MGYMWGIAFTFSNQIEDLYLFLGKFLNISFQITNPYTDWLSLSLTSFLSFVITLYQITLSSVLEIMPFLFIFTILNIIFQFSAEKFVDFHKSEEHINHVLDEINNLTKEK